MPNIPINSPIGYIGVFLSIFGIFLIMAGLNVVKIEKITVIPGRKTWLFGVFILLLGVVFLWPDISTSFSLQTPSGIKPNSSDIYDDFSDSSNDSSINQIRWIPFDESAGHVYQQDGKLIISRSAESQGTMGVSARTYRKFTIDTPMYFEIKLKINEYQEGAAYFGLFSDSSSGEYTNCKLGYGDQQAEFSCEYYADSNGDNNLYTTGVGYVDFGVWHIFRIEIEPSNMLLTYYLDDQKIGSYIPENVEELGNARFTFDMGINGTSSEKLTAYIDEVRIGEIR